MQEIRSFPSPDGTCVVVGQDLNTDIEGLVSAGKIDCIIVASEHGYSPLGYCERHFASEIGVTQDELRRLADWNRYKNERVTLIALPSRRRESRLRGLILAPSETSDCYKQFAVPFFGAPYRDFFYNVTYEALSYATQHWGARRVGTFHLSAGNNFHSDIALCEAEAVAHFAGKKSYNAKLDSFCFIGCCITSAHLSEETRIQLISLAITGESRRRYPQRMAMISLISAGHGAQLLVSN